MIDHLPRSGHGVSQPTHNSHEPPPYYRDSTRKLVFVTADKSFLAGDGWLESRNVRNNFFLYMKYILPLVLDVFFFFFLGTLSARFFVKTLKLFSNFIDFIIITR